MAGITKIINGEVAQSKSKGKAFVKALNSAMAPSAIAKKTPKKNAKKAR